MKFVYPPQNEEIHVPTKHTCVGSRKIISTRKSAELLVIWDSSREGILPRPRPNKQYAIFFEGKILQNYKKYMFKFDPQKKRVDNFMTPEKALLVRESTRALRCSRQKHNPTPPIELLFHSLFFPPKKEAEQLPVGICESLSSNQYSIQ